MRVCVCLGRFNFLRLAYNIPFSRFPYSPHNLLQPDGDADTILTLGALHNAIPYANNHE